MILEGSEEEKLFETIENEDIEKVKSLLKNSTENKKILKLNEKDEYGWYPLLLAILRNNIKIVQLLIEYALQHQIILELNEKNKLGNYPLYWAIGNNNIKIVKLLLEYALRHRIVLEYNESDIEDKPEIKNLFQNYEKEIENRKKVNK